MYLVPSSLARRPSASSQTWAILLDSCGGISEPSFDASAMADSTASHSWRSLSPCTLRPSSPLVLDVPFRFSMSCGTRHHVLRSNSIALVLVLAAPDSKNESLKWLAKPSSMDAQNLSLASASFLGLEVRSNSITTKRVVGSTAALRMSASTMSRLLSSTAAFSSLVALSTASQAEARSSSDDPGSSLERTSAAHALTARSSAAVSARGFWSRFLPPWPSPRARQTSRAASRALSNSSPSAAMAPISPITGLPDFWRSLESLWGEDGGPKERQNAFKCITSLRSIRSEEAGSGGWW